jgi:pyruvate/2-oxoglutarate dehydrogenase complex dihydrolipoamide dehydrogenase (E3) component
VRDGAKVLELEGPEVPGGREELAADALLVAVGRAPNVEGLGLEAAGVAHDRRGVTVDERLRSTNPRVFAAGDVASPYKFTHAADALARLAIANALFFGRGRKSALVVPWCTYTDPELAQVGMTVADAQAAGVAIDTYTVDLSEVDRARLDGDEGLLKVHVRKGGDRIVGATLVARHAGETISELTLAMVAGAGLATLAKTIHPYPTQAEAVRRAGDAYNKTRLTPLVAKLLERVLRLRR